MTICLCGLLAELFIGSAHLPQARRRTPATWCGPPGCAKGPGIHHSQPEAGGPAHRTNRSERGSRVDLFLVADLVLVDALLLMRAAWTLTVLYKYLSSKVRTIRVKTDFAPCVSLFAPAAC